MLIQYVKFLFSTNIHGSLDRSFPFFRVDAAHSFIGNILEKHAA